MSPRLATFVDFMAYARKLDSWMKRENLKTFGEFMNSLWNTFQRYAKNSERLDIVFDNYLSSSVKAGERARRSHQSAGVRAIISYIDQPLPPKSELAKFWAHNENKIHLQQFFIAWLEQNIDIDIPVYLGGCNENNLYSCCRLVCGNKDEIRLLYCEHEEADDTIPY